VVAAPGPAGEETRIDFASRRHRCWWRATTDLLHRAVFNLVLNAVQHAGSGRRGDVELDRPG
jgi:signal transduction histidine kinase